jgi:hypothetical protein
VTVTYPGASADTVQSTVVQVIEQQLSGIDHLLYFSSESDKDGSMTITLSFDQGTDADIAQVQVQNKVQLATPLLPQEVQQQGIRVAKATKNFLLVVGFVSTDGSLSAADIADFIASTIQDPISRTTFSCSARNTRCGSGSIPRSSTSIRSRRSTCRRPFKPRTCRSHPANSAVCPRSRDNS